MSAVPCQPSDFHEGMDAYVVCAGALSQELAMQLSSRRWDRPMKVGPGGGTILCADCADNLSLILGNIEAVGQEWGAA